LFTLAQELNLFHGRGNDANLKGFAMMGK